MYYSPDPGDPIFIAEKSQAGLRGQARDPPALRDLVAGRTLVFRARDTSTRWTSGASPRLVVTEQTDPPQFAGRLPRLSSTIGPWSTGMRGRVRVRAPRDEQHIPHAVSAGIEEYVSVGTGQRLVATVRKCVRNLWTVPITDHAVDDLSVSQLVCRPCARTPRFGPDYLLYLGSKGAANGLWRFEDNSDVELWKGSEGAVVNAPAVSHPDLSRGPRGVLSMASDGTNMRAASPSLDVRGAPSWSPDMDGYRRHPRARPIRFSRYPWMAEHWSTIVRTRIFGRPTAATSSSTRKVGLRDGPPVGVTPDEAPPGLGREHRRPLPVPA